MIADEVSVFISFLSFINFLGQFLVSLFAMYSMSFHMTIFLYIERRKKGEESKVGGVWKE